MIYPASGARNETNGFIYCHPGSTYEGEQRMFSQRMFSTFAGYGVRYGGARVEWSVGYRRTLGFTVRCVRDCSAEVSASERMP